MDLSTEEKEQLLQLEKELLQTDTRRSQERLAALLAEEFIEFGASGKIYNKQQTLKALASEDMSLQINLSNFSARRLAKNLALVTYQSEKRSDGTKTLYALRSSIWRQTRNGWRILFHQATPGNSGK